MKNLKKLLLIGGFTALSTIGLLSLNGAKEYAILPGIMVGVGAGAYYQAKKEEKYKYEKKRKEFQENILERYFDKYGTIINEERDQNNFERELIKIEKLKVFNLYDNTIEMILPNKNN
jgi:hypothetical protein